MRKKKKKKKKKKQKKKKTKKRKEKKKKRKKNTNNKNITRKRRRRRESPTRSRIVCPPFSTRPATIPCALAKMVTVMVRPTPSSRSVMTRPSGAEPKNPAVIGTDNR